MITPAQAMLLRFEIESYRDAEIARAMLQFSSHTAEERQKIEEDAEYMRRRLNERLAQLSQPSPDLARADRLLSADELREKYSTSMHGGEHPQKHRAAWRSAVEVGDTLRGYWDWVAAQLEEDE